MSSIRPLATITVLAFLGVFLYLKINETEPPLPEGVEDWSANTDIQFDVGGPNLEAEPSFELSAGGVQAPPFSSPTTPGTPATGDTAPAFNPTPPTTAAPPAAASAASGVEPKQEDVAAAATQELPDLPPLPTLPPAPSTAPRAAASTGTTATADSPPSTKGPSTPPETKVASDVGSPTSTSTASAAQVQSSLFSATRLHVQAALDRGELSQALLLLSDWYGDPSLSAEEAIEVNTLLDQRHYQCRPIATGSGAEGGARPVFSDRRPR